MNLPFTEKKGETFIRTKLVRYCLITELLVTYLSLWLVLVGTSLCDFHYLIQEGLNLDFWFDCW